MGLEMGLDGPWGKLDVMGWDWDGTVPKPGNLDGTGNFGHGTTLLFIVRLLKRRKNSKRFVFVAFCCTF